MEHTFKAGDRVRVVGSRPVDWDAHPNWTDLMDEYAGREGVVVSTNTAFGFIKVRFENGVHWNFKPSWLIPVQAQEESLLKVGDRVRVLGGIAPVAVGCVLTIDRVDADDPRLPYRADGYWFGKDDVELVTPSLSRPSRKSNPCVDATKGFFSTLSPKETTSKLPLINKTRLLTAIKLD